MKKRKNNHFANNNSVNSNHISTHEESIHIHNIHVEPVDDLAFAATFANCTAYNEDVDSSSARIDTNNAIAMSIQESINDHHHHESKTREDELHNNNNDESDDESDVDLTQELLQMQNHEEDYHDYHNAAGASGQMKHTKNKSSMQQQQQQQQTMTIPKNIPKTQNEVDLYNCPIEDLNKLDILDINIDINTATIDQRPSAECDGNNDDNNNDGNNDVNDQSNINMDTDTNMDKSNGVPSSSTTTTTTTTTSDHATESLNVNNETNHKNPEKKENNTTLHPISNVITFQCSNNNYGIINATIPTNKLIMVRKLILEKYRPTS